MEEYLVKDGKRLRLGYTTGSCAAAAAKAAAWMLLTGRRKESIRLQTPKGIELNLKVLDIQMLADETRCAIRKDSGDDPDVTRGTLIFAAVRKSATPGVTIDGGDDPDVTDGALICAQVALTAQGICIDGGEGVGRVTRPGLNQPVGAAAINSVPRQMIEENVREVCALVGYDGGLDVTISAPEGEALAKKTFNPRLGIEGGISILGTTGIVEPMSEQALLDTIRVELRQRRENGADYILLAPGNYGADYIRDFIGLDPKTAVLTSNFIGDSLEFCKEFGFHGALLIGHIGKFVKLAGGMWNTHSKFGDCRMEIIASHSAALGLRAERTEEILHCATCDDALRILDEEGLKDAFLVRLGQRIGTMLGYKSGELQSGAILFSKEYGFLCETEGAEELLEQIREG